MPHTAAVLTDRQSIAALATDWDKLVAEAPADLMGLDGTATHCWFEALVSAMPEAADPRVLVTYSEQELTGVMPLVATRRGWFGSELSAATDLYGGRNSPLVKALEPAPLTAMLAHLADAFPDWACLRYTLVVGSPQAELFSSACKRLGYAIQEEPLPPTPFFPLLASEEEFQRGISKSLAQKMRSSRNKATKQGKLEFREFTAEGEADELMQALLEVERNSWKHRAGSAITTQPQQQAFYRELFPRAMRQGLLIGLVLYFDDRPIAYQIGLLRGQVFAWLKSSMVEHQDQLRPSFLLKAELNNRLRSRGVLTIDCMGVTEPHKLLWSQQNGSYSRVEYVVYNKGWRGRALLAARRLRALLQTKGATASSSKSSEEAES